MKFFLKLLSSRTILSVALLFVLGGIQAIEGFLPTEWYLLFSGILGLLAGFFRIKPKVQF